MSWRGPGALREDGRQREGVEITCDGHGCNAFEILGWHGGSVEKIQRLLVRRGWTYTSVVDGGKDLCPSCSVVTAVSA